MNDVTTQSERIRALEIEIQQLQRVNVEIERRYVNAWEDAQKTHARLAELYAEALRLKQRARRAEKLFRCANAAKRATRGAYEMGHADGAASAAKELEHERE